MSEKWQKIVGGERTYKVEDSQRLSYREPDYYGGDSDVTFDIDFDATVKKSPEYGFDVALRIDVRTKTEADGQALSDEVLRVVKEWHARHPAHDWDKHPELSALRAAQPLTPDFLRDLVAIVTARLDPGPDDLATVNTALQNFARALLEAL